LSKHLNDAAMTGFAIALAFLTGGCATAMGEAASSPRETPMSVASYRAASATTSAVDPTPSPETVADATPSPDSDPSPSVAPDGSPQTEWTLDLYKWEGLRRQYPDQTACTAASVLIALNLIALDGSNTQWSPTVTYHDQERVLDYERGHMTLPTSVRGSDAHGTRNALNYYGWGSEEAGVYVDAPLTSFGAAAKAIVASIARTRKPAIIFTWLGSHSQVVTGYRVTGADPAKSDDFTILGVYLTDPLEGKESLIYGGAVHTVYTAGDDTWVTLASWQRGSDSVRFTQFYQTDSTLRDPIDGRIGKSEWHARWVVVLATR
jgi:hypothetical protein